MVGCFDAQRRSSFSLRTRAMGRTDAPDVMRPMGRGEEEEERREKERREER
jgi:hypothetical protein